MASAVVAVEPPEEQRPATNVLKRRQSDTGEEEQEKKRQRKSPGKNSPTAPRGDAEEAAIDEQSAVQEEPKVVAREARRKSSIADEKQRSRRLFGALLGSLNQPGDRTSKRRQEIESRKKAELQRQDDERLEDKLRWQEKLTERRKKEQERLDEQNMYARHSDLLHLANFLQTTAEPKLYWRPWQLQADEEDRIEAQLKQAQAQVEQELAEFNQRYHRNGEVDDNSNTERPPSDEPEASQTHDLEPAQQAPATVSNETSNTVEDEGSQAQAKSDDLAEVPDSEPTDPLNTNDNLTAHESMNGHAGDESKGTEEQNDGDLVVGEDDDAPTSR